MAGGASSHPTRRIVLGTLKDRRLIGRSNAYQGTPAAGREQAGMVQLQHWDASKTYHIANWPNWLVLVKGTVAVDLVGHGFTTLASK